MKTMKQQVTFHLSVYWFTDFINQYILLWIRFIPTSNLHNKIHLRNVCGFEKGSPLFKPKNKHKGIWPYRNKCDLKMFEIIKISKNILSLSKKGTSTGGTLSHFCPPLRSTFAVRETASLGIMGEPMVPPLNPSETIVLWEHYRLWGV